MVINDPVSSLESFASYSLENGSEQSISPEKWSI